MNTPALPKAPLTVLEMVHSALLEGGFDGLYNTWDDCACLTGELCPFEFVMGGCRAGYLLPHQSGDSGGFSIGQKPSESVKP